MTYTFFVALAPSRYYSKKVSSRGGVRKAPTAIGWVQSLTALGEADTTKIIKGWNDQATRTDRIVGGKLQSVARSV